jgi:hypothetical protein
MYVPSMFNILVSSVYMYEVFSRKGMFSVIVFVITVSMIE